MIYNASPWFQTRDSLLLSRHLTSESFGQADTIPAPCLHPVINSLTLLIRIMGLYNHDVPRMGS